MINNRDEIFGDLDVKLDNVGAGGDGVLQGGDRVFADVGATKNN